MRRLAMLTLLLALMAGCDVDPATGSFPIGTEAIIYRDPEAEGKFDGDDTTMARISVKEGTGVIGLDFLNVRVGTRVRIIDDSHAGPDDRKPVAVRVMEGPNADRMGTIPRDNLRPIPR
jgi:hypothetical protein